MKKARILSKQELRRVLDHIATRPHAERNRAIIMTMRYAGLRACEVASLKIKDVLDAQGQIKNEIYLTAQQTKGKSGRSVLINSKLCKELSVYIQGIRIISPEQSLWPTQKNSIRGFTANGISGFFCRLFKEVGLEGVSSHGFRREFITTLANKSVGIHTIMSLSGHRRLSSVQEYLSVTDEHRRQAVELL
jgi:integrase/recombinase XerD